MVENQQILADLLKHAQDQGKTLAVLVDRVESLISHHEKMNGKVADLAHWRAGNVEMCRAHRDDTRQVTVAMEAQQVVIAEHQRWIDQEKGSRRAVIIVSHIVSFLIGTVISVIAAIAAWGRK